MKLSPKKKKELFDALIASTTFSKPTTTTMLLKYLFEATEKGINLKESVIELDFFREKQSNDKNNSIVRVNVYNLRKKLSHYYEDEGKNSEYRLDIEKGQYKIKFIPFTNDKNLFETYQVPKYILGILLAITSLALIITYWPPSKPELWKSFLNSKKGTSLYIGDFFGFSGATIFDGSGWSRDYKINTIKEFYSAMEKRSDLDKTHKPAQYSYTTSMAPIATQKLQSMFQTYNQSFPIRFSSKSSIPEIKSRNAIYIGAIKNDNPFIHFFNEGNPYFKILGNSLQFSNHQKNKDTIFDLSSTGKKKEYAIVAKIPGPENTTQFIFFSDHDIGVESTIQYFTNKDKLDTFSSKHKLFRNTYFVSVFLVSGKDRSNTGLKEILTVDFNK